MAQLRLPAAAVEGATVKLGPQPTVRYWALLPPAVGAVLALAVPVAAPISLLFAGAGVLLALLVLVMTQFRLYVTQDQRLVTRNVLFWHEVQLTALVSARTTNTKSGDHLWLEDQTGSTCLLSMADLKAPDRVLLARTLRPYVLAAGLKTEGPVGTMISRYTG